MRLDLIVAAASARLPRRKGFPRRGLAHMSLMHVHPVRRSPAPPSSSPCQLPESALDARSRTDGRRRLA
uniref:Uncharacterized protein n=1 Tax=Arundo donax TaxID=35708 RepID=A0A0A8YEG6_ARUDO